MVIDFYCPNCYSYFVEDLEPGDSLNCGKCHIKLIVVNERDPEDEEVIYQTVIIDQENEDNLW